MQEFEIFGGYNSLNSVGKLSGQMRIYDDDRLVGVINDSKEDVLSQAGIFFGLKDNFYLNFWKFSKNNPESVEFYALQKVYGGYGGKWAPVGVNINSLIEGFGENQGIRELEFAAKSNISEKTLDMLGMIEKERIELYTIPEMVRYVLENSPNECYLKLERINNLVVN